jgi:hypothetical protein
MPGSGRSSIQSFAVHEQGQPIGKVDIRSAGPKTMEFFNLAVEPRFRKQGWGKHLIGMALQAGTVQGKTLVQLESQDNGSGRLTRWYGKMGFNRVGTSERMLPVMAAPISTVQAMIARMPPSLPGAGAASVQPKMPGTAAPARPGVAQAKPAGAPGVPAPCGGRVAIVQPKMPAAPAKPAPPPAPRAQVRPTITVVAQTKPAMPLPAPPRAQPAAVRPPGFGNAVQRARLSKSKAKALEDAMDAEIDAMIDSGAYDEATLAKMMGAYNSFEEGSNKLETKHSAVSSGFSAATTQILDWTTVRAANYPSGFSSAADLARDTYVNAHKNPLNAAQWQCPGTSTKPAHWAPTSDVSIDHIVPVATHWNSTGYNTSRAVRNTWYNDTSNHAYVCKSCNSSMGSGGVFYTKPPGPGYSG